MLLRLVTQNLTFHSFKTASILRNPSLFRQNFRNLFQKNSTKTRKSEKLLISRPLTLTLGIGTSFLVKSHLSVARCEVNRTTELRVAENDSVKFDWRRFWQYLKNHIWKLLGAIAAALAVAFLNINIPSLLGQLVNALSNGIKYSGSDVASSSDFLMVKIEK